MIVSASIAPQIFAGIDDGGSCKSDIECTSYCCNNDQDYSHNGICLKIHEDDRCKARAFRSRIALVSYLTLFVLLILICGILKRRELNKDAAYLKRIKDNAKNK